LIIILAFGTLGGFLVFMLEGFSVGQFRKFPGFKLKPILGSTKIPPFVGMVLFGMIARNCFGPRMLAYNSTWTSSLKSWV
jgi:hypothetical protein